MIETRELTLAALSPKLAEAALRAKPALPYAGWLGWGPLTSLLGETYNGCCSSEADLRQTIRSRLGYIAAAERAGRFEVQTTAVAVADTIVGMLDQPDGRARTYPLLVNTAGMALRCLGGHIGLPCEGIDRSGSWPFTALLQFEQTLSSEYPRIREECERFLGSPRSNEIVLIDDELRPLASVDRFLIAIAEGRVPFAESSMSQ
jgi:hypothetical protein